MNEPKEYATSDKPKWAVASNCSDTIQAAVGETVRGFYLDEGRVVLVFESGWGLCIGSAKPGGWTVYWCVAPAEVQKHVGRLRAKWEEAAGEAARLAAMAGTTPTPTEAP